MRKRLEIDADVINVFWAALVRAERQLVKRDEMNAEIHLASVRLSPLTVMVQNARRRAADILGMDDEDLP